MKSSLLIVLRIGVLACLVLAIFALCVTFYRYWRRQKVAYKPPYAFLFISQGVNIFYGAFALYVTHEILPNLIAMLSNGAIMVWTLYMKGKLRRLDEERGRLILELMKEAAEKQRTALSAENKQLN